MIFNVCFYYKIQWGRGGDGNISPFLFQIRSIRPVDPNLSLYIVVTAPLPSPQHPIVAVLEERQFHGWSISKLQQHESSEPSGQAL